MTKRLQFGPRYNQEFSLLHVVQTVSGPIQPPIQWAPVALFSGLKRPRSEADHSPPSSADIKKTWIYTSTLPYVFMGKWENLHCLHPVVYHAWWYLAVSTTINKNKPIKLLTLVLFNGCYMFRSTHGAIFRQLQTIARIMWLWCVVLIWTPPMVSPPYRDGGVWVFLRPWELCRR
jgi:hypothetical protein